MRKISTKRFAGWPLSFLLCASILFAPFASTPVQAAEADKETKITLLGTSDIHGRFMPWDYALDGPNPTGSMTQALHHCEKSPCGESQHDPAGCRRHDSG